MDLWLCHAFPCVTYCCQFVHRRCGEESTYLFPRDVIDPLIQVCRYGHLVELRVQEVQTFTDHISAVDTNIKCTREDTSDNRLTFRETHLH